MSNIIERLLTLCDPMAEAMPDGVRLTELINAGREAANEIAALKSRIEIRASPNNQLAEPVAERAEMEALTPMSGFLVFLKDMRFTGSWDLPTLDRAIEVGETIVAQSALASPAAISGDGREAVAWQYRYLYEDETWSPWGERRADAEALLASTVLYAEERRPLTRPSSADAVTEAMVRQALLAYEMEFPYNSATKTTAMRAALTAALATAPEGGAS